MTGEGDGPYCRVMLRAVEYNGSSGETEEKGPEMNRVTAKKVINVASVPHRSPFRYPGGKTWLVPHVRRWLSSIEWKPEVFFEPFAGGGIVSLSVAFEGLADRVLLIEKDDDVAAVWKVILNGKAKDLADRIVEFDLEETRVRELLAKKHRSLFDRAFATIVRNRVQRGGILAPGASLLKHGENGKGIKSRWYPETLKKRILDISEIKDRIEFVHGDGIEVLRNNAGQKKWACLIDPPYTVAGQRLYVHSEVDHEALFSASDKFEGDFLMTYDNAGPVLDLAKKHLFETKTVAMKNTHHAVMTELLIGRNLNWCV